MKLLRYGIIVTSAIILLATLGTFGYRSYVKWKYGLHEQLVGILSIDDVVDKKFADEIEKWQGYKAKTGDTRIILGKISFEDFDKTFRVADKNKYFIKGRHHKLLYLCGQTISHYADRNLLDDIDFPVNKHKRILWLPTNNALNDKIYIYSYNDENCEFEP